MLVKELVKILSVCDPNAEIYSNDLYLRTIKLDSVNKINQADCFYNEFDKRMRDQTNQSKVKFIWSRVIT